MVHKMDSERVGCSHSDKAYGDVGDILKREQQYICRDCGEEGTVLGVTWPSGDYNKLRSKKEQGGFSVPR